MLSDNAKSHTKPKIVSLFSGCGGMDLGFINAGFDVIYANEIDKNACRTYRNNIGSHIVEGDIRSVDIDSIPYADGVIGGFPCKDFSIVQANKRKGIDGRYGRLFEYMIDVIRSTKPKFFVAENVLGITTAKGGKQIIEEFKKLDYNVTVHKVNFADYGVSQNRKRVLIIGTKFDYDLVPPTHYVHITSGDAISNISKDVENHNIQSPTKFESQILPLIPEGKCIRYLYDTDKELIESLSNFKSPPFRGYMQRLDSQKTISHYYCCW